MNCETMTMGGGCKRKAVKLLWHKNHSSPHPVCEVHLKSITRYWGDKVEITDMKLAERFMELK